MSLMVHPAPRITKAPRPKTARRAGSGRQPAGVARARLHPHGHNNSQVPANYTVKTSTVPIFPFMKGLSIKWFKIKEGTK
jgi:hypothetical protein